MSNVFISHSWHDKKLARKLADTLESYGVRVWLDDAEIKLGDSLIEKIRQGIDEMEYVIALLSEKSVSSEWVKKELEIAMNQEIKGKRVKVLPILAQSCTLPGFLEGKLYADMSTPKTYRQSLSLLLDRLNIDIKLVSKAAKTPTLGKFKEERKRASKIIERLAGTDQIVQYRTLKEIKNYYDRNLFLFPGFADAITKLAYSSNPPHIRLQALHVLGFSDDSNFAVKLEPFLGDENSAIVCAAIDTLTHLRASQFARRISELLRTSKDISIRDSCLKYFAQLEHVDEATMLSLLDTFSIIKGEGSEDPGTELIVVQVLAQLWNGYRDEALEELLNYGSSKVVKVRLEVITALAKQGGEIDISSPRLREQFQRFLKRAFESGTDLELAKAWCLGFASEDFDNKDIWEAILASDRYSVDAFLSELSEWNPDVLFNSEGHLTAFQQLLEKFDEIRPEVCSVLARIANVESLKLLSAYNYDPQSWDAIDVLSVLAGGEKWDESFNGLLEKAINSEFEYIEDVGLAFTLLALFRAGKLSLDELIEQFPKELSIYPNRARVMAVQLLNKLKEAADTQQRRKLTKMIQIIQASTFIEDDY